MGFDGRILFSGMFGITFAFDLVHKIFLFLTEKKLLIFVLS